MKKKKKHAHTKQTNKQTQKPRHYNQPTVKIWQILMLHVVGPCKKVRVVFVIYFAPSTHSKYDFIPFTSHQWALTWKPRICHITLSTVKLSGSKTEQGILYEVEGMLILNSAEQGRVT